MGSQITFVQWGPLIVIGAKVSLQNIGKLCENHKQVVQDVLTMCRLENLFGLCLQLIKPQSCYFHDLA